MKNKLLISFILFILILSFFTCSFAFEYSQGDLSVELDDSLKDFKYIIIFKQYYNYNDKMYYGILVSNNEVYFDTNKFITSDLSNNYFYYHDGQFRRPNSSGGYKVTGYATLDTLKNITLSDMTSVSNIYFGSISDYLDKYGDNPILSANFNLCNSSGDVVFQGAPVNQVTIPAIQQVEEIPQVMEQVMKILIPIGLIVFSIGLVIYLTRLVISRVQ